MSRKLTYTFLIAISMPLGVSSPSQAQLALNPYPVTPRNRVITPFGYGSVTQIFNQKAGNSGTAQCASMSKALKCLSVSGASSCSKPVPAGQIVSCGSAAKPQVNESNFQPINCLGNLTGAGGWSSLLGYDDFCLVANYMPSRSADTLYQFNDYVRLGVNTAFGGAIFELYGSDKIDRILQNSGAAMQLSLWAFSPNYASSIYPRAYYAIPSTKTPAWKNTCNATPYPTNAACQSSNPGLTCEYGVEGPNQADCKTVFPCADRSHAAGASLDPLQAVSLGCDTGLPSGYVDSVTSPGPGLIAISKSNPINYTFSNAFPKLTWTQTSQVQGPCALVTYTIANPGNLTDSDFQEIPALVLHGGANQFSYYYTGPNPYADVAGPVSGLTMSQIPGITQGGPILFQMPNRPGPFGAAPSGRLSEDWVSTCDILNTSCYTIASFSSSSQDVVIGMDQNAPYAGIHGFFSITKQLNRTIQLAVCPYRFDDVVGGETIRAFIYSLHSAFLASGGN